MKKFGNALLYGLGFTLFGLSLFMFIWMGYESFLLLRFSEEAAIFFGPIAGAVVWCGFATGVLVVYV